MEDSDEPKIWVSALKVIIGISVMIGVVGLALWLASLRPAHSPALEKAREKVQQQGGNTDTSSSKSWGIAKDSPLRRKHPLQVQDILDCWFDELAPKQHFLKDGTLDDVIRTRFGLTLEAAARYEL